MSVKIPLDLPDAGLLQGLDLVVDVCSALSSANHSLTEREHRISESLCLSRLSFSVETRSYNIRLWGGEVS